MKQGARSGEGSSRERGNSGAKHERRQCVGKEGKVGSGKCQENERS